MGLFILPFYNIWEVDYLIEEHIVVGKDRHITVPESLRRIAVQFDHNVETVTFDCPRYWDNNDLSEMTVYINYMRKDRARGKAEAKNVRVDEKDKDIIHFDWTISRNATLMKGELRFLVCIIKTDEAANETVHWNSELCSQMYISEGLESDDEIENFHADIITDLLVRMDKVLIANSPILDGTLTERGLAADAKAVGDRFIELISDVQNSDNILAENLYRETAERKAELDVERKRIDKIVKLPSGSTSGDAELMDIRLGANGVEYDTAGTAIRSQLSSFMKSASRVYRFDIGGIANTLGTVSANRTRMRTVIPYLEPKFSITNFKLPENVSKATVLALRDGAFIKDIFSSLAYDGESLYFDIENVDEGFDSIGITFQHNDGSEFTVEEIETSYIEYRVSSEKMSNVVDKAKRSCMLNGKLRRGVISASGVFAENSVALSTEFIKVYDDEFVLLGMEDYLFLRCVGKDEFGNYSQLNVYPEEGGYRVKTSDVDSIAFSFYKGIVDGSHVSITEEECERASFFYSSSIVEFQSMLEDNREELLGRISEVEDKIVSVSGSKMVSLGDSVTYGFIPRNAPGYPGQLDSFAALTAKHLGMTFENYGISGSTVANIEGRSPMCDRVANLPGDANIVTFMGGTNDIRNGVRLGVMSDRTKDTFYGALHLVMSTLYKKYVLDGAAKVVVCTPIKLLDASSAKQNDTEGNLVNLRPWVDAIKEVAEYYSLPVLDFYNTSKINPHLNRTVKGTDVDYNGYYNPHITDGTHPTQEGAKLMADQLIAFLKTI